MYRFWNSFVTCLCTVSLLTARIAHASTIHPTYNDSKTLLATLLDGYDANTRPVANQSQPITVDMTMFAISIQEFDEVTGMFSFVAALSLTWTDINLWWYPWHYGDIQSIVIPYDKVWVPELSMSNPSDDYDALGKSWHRIRYYYGGMASWIPVHLFKSTCDIDVTYYPFDKQTCMATFGSLVYYGNEVSVSAYQDSINLMLYKEHVMWQLEDTHVYSLTGYKNQIDFTFHLKRKPAFIIVNVILPILFLSLLNVLVFLLVPESGERASFSITVLLSIAVFLTIVNDTLPKSSQPVPIISYKLMIDMVTSALIVVSMVTNMRFYNRSDEEPVPAWLTLLYSKLTCRCRSNGRKEVQPSEASTLTKPYFISALGTDKVFVNDCGYLYASKHDNGNKNGLNPKEHVWVEKETDETTEMTSSRDVTEANKQPVTWKQISYMLDWIALIFFTTLTLTNITVFIILTAYRGNYY